MSNNLQQNLPSSINNLAIIGCGAVTELCHLPALKHTKNVKVTTLVDRNVERAKLLAERFEIKNVVADYKDLTEIDGALIALPHHLHAPVTIEFLNKRIPVLVEKPMSLNADEAQVMIDASVKNDTPLQIGLMYRFCNGPRIVKRAISEGWLGELKSFDVEWGFVYNWPVASGFFFDKAQSGGGVLMDFGSHVLDLLVWWLGNEVVALDYHDDNMGGVEAECKIGLTFNTQTGPIEGDVNLSRLRQLRDRARIVGEHITIECDLFTPDIVNIFPNSSEGQELIFKIDFEKVPRQSIELAYAEQLQAFSQTISGKTAPIVSGHDVLYSVALIDRCYEERKQLIFSFNDFIYPERLESAA